MKYAMLINYGYCVGCHTCEVACQKHLGLDPSTFGIKLTEIGPDEVKPDAWQYDYMPVITDRCDKCEERIGKGKKPLCVQSCFTDCMRVAPLDEILKDAPDSKCVVYF